MMDPTQIADFLSALFNSGSQSDMISKAILLANVFCAVVAYVFAWIDSLPSRH